MIYNSDSNNQGGSINDITNLKFYTAKGYEIPMKKQYVLQWEFIPGELASKYLQASLNGYFIGDIDFTEPNNLKILPQSLQVQFVNNGEFYVRFATESAEDENHMPVYEYDDIESSTGLLPQIEYYDYVKELFLKEDNKIKVSINVKNKSFEHTFNINDIFTINKIADAEPIDSSKYVEYTIVKTIYTGENITENQHEFYQTISLSKIDLVELEENPGMSVIQQIFEDSVPNIGVYFPFVRYIGDYYQDRVSSKFIAADTILVLEEVRNEDDTFDYVTPYINEDTEYSLVFQPETDSELKIIDSASEYEIKYKDEVAFSMADKPKLSEYADPFSFAVGFQAEDEGAYQNLLGIYLRSKNDNDVEHVFFMGVISFKSEVEGEDERFRTLLTDFGVPDPKYYSNIFAEQDYQEQGEDFKLINKKSKELMLTYDQIFSYVGTYKALIRAIKFLGYQDVIFKEWYSIKDTNDKLTDVAIQVFDSSTGDFLKQKLADYGVSIEDYTNYNKLNRLSMIYHFNEQDKDIERLKTTISKYNKETGEIEINGNFTAIKEVPITKPVFIYRNDEILTKLFAVKQWLEQHIIGVGAYIADITGEGIYFSWQKTQGYQTQHHLNDFSQAQYYTADVKEVSEFVDSSAIISCTLNELNNAVRFVDYDKTPIAAFDKYDISINLTTDDGTRIDASVLTISNSIEAPVLGDEYEFDLVNRPDSGTLHEWMPIDSSDEILFQDGEIKFLFDETREANIDSSCLPIITLENANIHNAYGNWRSNVKWMIRETIDPETGNTKYKLQNYKVYLANSNQKVVDQYVIIEPDIKVDASGNIIDMPYIKYSEKNKWDIPMFIIHGYKFVNIDISTHRIIDPSTGEWVDESEYYNLDCSANNFVLEILKGDMLFKDRDNCGCQVSFTSDLIQTDYTMSANTTYVNEQQIQPTYTYHSERKAFVNLDSSTIETETNTIIECQNDILKIENEIEANMSEIYNNIIENIENINSGISENNNPALIDTKSYIHDASFVGDIAEFIQVKQNAYKKELLDNVLETIIDANYVCNSSIPVKVTRLGQYDLINRSFDKYNNIFPSKYDNKVDVTAAPIPMDAYISNVSSLNDETFYKYNIDGSLQNKEQLDVIMSYCENKAKYPKSYHIYDIDYNLDNDFIEFDNISYALDTPKNNDYVVFDTMNERCVDVSEGNGLLRLMMLDENPDKIFLYADISDNIEKKVSVFVYDPILKEIVYKVENAHVLDSFKVDSDKDVNYNADSWIDISIDNTNELTRYVNDQYKIFVLNTTEYPIDSSNIELDYYNKETNITFNYNQVFNKEDVIKIRYYMDVNIGYIKDSIKLLALYVNGVRYEPKTNVFESALNLYMEKAKKELNIFSKYYNMPWNIDSIRNGESVYIENSDTAEKCQQIYLDFTNLYRPLQVENIQGISGKKDVSLEFQNTIENMNHSNGQIINETAYRIIDILTNDDGYTYKINGLPNTQLIERDDVHPVLMYAAQYPVKYTSKIIGRAYEFNEKIGLNNYSIIRDHFNFNSTQLFLNDYIDDTYGIEINDYDYINGEKYWLDFNEYANDTSIMEMYYYHQFPISAEQGHNMIFRSHDIRNTFIPNYKVDWKIAVETVDELNNISENVNNSRKETLFRSINNYLTIKPYMLGSHDIELTCTDIYGNRLINKGEGILYIKENKENSEYYNYGYV